MVRVGLRTTEIAWKITFPKLRSSFVSPLLDTLNTKESKTRVRRNTRPGKSKQRWLQLTSICSGVHESRFTDFTLDIWTPKFRCIPAQRIQRKTPRFHDAHRGPVERRTRRIIHQEVRFFWQTNAKPVTEDERRPSILCHLSLRNLNSICSLPPLAIPIKQPDLSSVSALCLSVL